MVFASFDKHCHRVNTVNTNPVTVDIFTPRSSAVQCPCSVTKGWLFRHGTARLRGAASETQSELLGTWGMGSLCRPGQI